MAWPTSSSETPSSDMTSSHKRRRESDDEQVRCLGTTKSGVRCRKARHSDGNRFCHLHTVLSPFSRLPNEIVHKIAARLEPHERMALALTNKHLAATTTQWNPRSPDQSIQPGPQMSIILVQDPSPSYEFVLIGDHDKLMGRRAVSGLGSGYYFKCFRYTSEEWNSNIEHRWTPIEICPTCHSAPGPSDRGHSYPPLIELHDVHYKQRPKPHLQSDYGILGRAIRDCPYLFNMDQLSCSLCKKTVTPEEHVESHFVCSDCVEQCAYFARWCEHCQGLPGPLQLARMFHYIQSTDFEEMKQGHWGCKSERKESTTPGESKSA